MWEKLFTPKISYYPSLYDFTKTELKIESKNIYSVKQFHLGEAKCIKVVLGYFSLDCSQLPPVLYNGCN